MRTNQFLNHVVPFHGHLFHKSLFNSHVLHHHASPGRFRNHHPWRGMFGASQVPDQQVLWAQSCLAQNVDPSVPQDGVMGPETQQALRTFQGQQGLPTTGGFDGGTIAALQAACSGQSASGPGPGAGQVTGVHVSHSLQPKQQEAMFEENEEREVRVEGRTFGLPVRPPAGRLFQNRWNWNHDQHGFPFWREARNLPVEALGGGPLASWAQSFALAQALGPLGFAGWALGITKSALLMFQKQNGLAEIGILDKGTADALQAVCGSQMPVQGETSEEEEVNSGERDFVSAQIAANQHDSNVLTDAVFFKRHPELGGRRLRADETKLGEEWLSIRENFVEPLLAVPSSAQNSSPVGAGSRDPNVRAALAIAQKPVPGMPGVTIQQLVEKWRLRFTPRNSVHRSAFVHPIRVRR